MARTNRQWVLAARPHGMLKESDFEYRETDAPSPGEGEVLVRTLYLSFDPAMRGWIEDRPSYMPPVQIGEVMRAGAVAEVAESRHPDFAPGDRVQGTFGWQDFAIARPGHPMGLTPIPDGVPLTWALGVLGGTGITAYFGMLDVGKPRRGETVVVSGAAGATGSVAAQIARIEGARVIGIAGGPEKCAWLTKEAQLDAAIDYKNESVERRLRELAPDGVNVYFDNVGGEILDAVLAQIAQGGRIALCGGISGYNDVAGPAPIRNYMALIIRRAKLEGFLLLDYVARFPEAVSRLRGWVESGEIVHQEDVQAGLEQCPKTLLRLFEGKNLGKQMLKVAEPEHG